MATTAARPAQADDRNEIRRAKNPTYVVKWKSRYTDAEGKLGPTARTLTEGIAKTNNRLFPDIDHWTERVAEGIS